MMWLQLVFVGLGPFLIGLLAFIHGAQNEREASMQQTIKILDDLVDLRDKWLGPSDRDLFDPVLYPNLHRHYDVLGRNNDWGC